MNVLCRGSLRFGVKPCLPTKPRSCPGYRGRRHASSKEPASPARPPQSAETKDAPIDIPSQLWYKRLGPVTDFLSWFHRTQGERPYTVQLVSSVTIYFCGDLLAQDLGGEPYDPFRTLRMLTIGAVAAIPGYRWFIFLGNHFNYPSKALSIATKTCVQQAVFTPVFNTYFFGMQAILSGEYFSGVIRRIKNAVPVSIKNSVKLWPAVTAFSFAFIMPQYRFMFSGIFAVCWQTYLSFLNRKEEKAVQDAHIAVSNPVLLQDPRRKQEEKNDKT